MKSHILAMSHALSIALALLASCKREATPTATQAAQVVAPSSAKPAPSEVTAAAAATPAVDRPMWQELGPVAFYQREGEVAKLLGAATAMSAAEFQAADGSWVKTGRWPSQGLTIKFGKSEDAADTAYEVVELTIEAPSSFRTKAGVGIGSSADEVKAAYGRDLNTDDSSAELLVVGDLYGGAIFSIENNQVKSIFIGAAGE